MSKKSINNRYNSKLILEELEARQLFSDGAAAVVPPPQTVDAAATVINVDANIEPVAESQSTSAVPAIPNADSTVELIHPEENTSPISAITADPTVNNPDGSTLEETGGNTSQLLTETETQAYVSSQENEVTELASIENNTNENTEILLQTDYPTVIENLSEDYGAGQLGNLSETDGINSSSPVSEETLSFGATDTLDGDSTLVNQSSLNDPSSTGETSPPEIEVCSSFDPLLVETKNEIIFVDSRVDDYQSLIDDITSHAKTGVDFEVILLDGGKDGITQITESLSHYHNLDSVHLISHGSDGSIDLGANQLNFQTLSQNEAQIKSWGDAFSANGDFLIYGCNVAETQFGQSFIDYLSSLTNVDIAASADNTGSSILGGDWNLEYQTGAIEAQSAISLGMQGQWDQLLAVTSNGTITSTQTTNATSLSWSHTVNSGSNRALFVEIAIDGVGANVTSVKYGTASLSLVGRTAGNHAVEIWVLVNPTVGTDNVVVTFAGSTAASAGASTFNGVNQSTATGAYAGASSQSTGNSTIASVSVNSATGDVVIDAQYWKVTGGNPAGTNQTTQWSQTISSGNTMLGASTTEAGATSVTMSGTAPSASQWEIGAVSVKAASSSPGITVDLINSITTEAGGTAQFSVFLNTAPTANVTIGLTSSDLTEGTVSPSSLTFTSANWSTPQIVTVTGVNDALVDGNIAYSIITAAATSTDSNYNGVNAADVSLINNDNEITSIVVVDTLNDTLDGNTSSIAALNSSKGIDGKISLREAITAANNSSGMSTIRFNIAGTGPYNFNLTSALPTITKPVVIDGTSEPDYTGSPIVVLNGGGTVQYGIQLSGGSDGSIIRGLILQNFTSSGISIGGSNSNTITGNWIGLNTAGTGAAGNFAGINLWNSSNNIIGGSTTADRNVISGNTSIGIGLNTDNGSTTGNQIKGNYIGTNASGTAAVGNANQGIWVNAAGNTIGGSALNEGNVISGTTNWVGIQLEIPASNTVISGNLIGLNATGTAALANAGGGIYVQSANNIIGGITVAARNVISGNSSAGINITGASAISNVVIGNYIGTDITGTQDVNGTSLTGGQSGVVIDAGATNNRIGTNADGSNDTAERNVISGNNWYGVEMLGSGTSGNVVQGNYIGTDKTGLVALGNSQGGVSFWNGASGNKVGSGLTGAGNVISGNGTGVQIANGVTNNKVQGNYIGLGSDGSTSIGNTGVGVYFYNGGSSAAVTGNIIGIDADGSNDVGERNIISGNFRGVALENTEVTGNVIAGNYIGTDATGQLDRGNTFDGVYILNGASNNIIGGSSAIQRNIISGNNDDGIQIDGEASDGNIIQNNWIGLGSNGTTVIGNGGDGIYVSGGADNTTIGGINLGNVIMGSGLVGIEVDGASTGTVIQGNYIGTNVAETVVLGSQQNGVLLENGASNTTIGGTLSGQGNVITDSGRGGAFTAAIDINPSAGTGNKIIANSIYGNPGIGIDLGVDGVTANDNLDPDTGGNNLQNFPVITSATTSGTGTVKVSGTLNTLANLSGVIIQLYATPSAGNPTGRQGKRYLGSTTVSTDASGNATFTNITLSATVTAGEILTATATYANNTSEFSQGVALTTPNTAPTFNAGNGNVTTTIGSGDDWARAMTLQSDGKMVVTGYSSNGINDDFSVVRYNVDGSLDTTFGTGGKVTIAVGSSSDQAYAITIQADGKILVAGNSHNGSNMDFSVIRLNTDGSLDTSFSGDGKVMVDFAGTTEDTQAVIVQSDGKIIIGGSSNSLFALTRLNTDGSLDTTFGSSGKVTTDATIAADSGYSLALQADGKILMAGAGNNNFALVRYNSNGSLDTSFGSSGKVETDLAVGADYGRSVIVNNDGTILVSGNSGSGNFAVAKYTSTGMLDTTFGSGTGIVMTDISGSDISMGIVIQADGKIILGGYNGSFNSTLVRYNVNGTLDTSFGNSGKVTTVIASGSFIEGLAVRPDGHIVAAVTATVSGMRDFGIITYLPDGSIDALFNTTSITNTLDGNPTYTENGSAVVLDSNVQIFDAELSLSNFNGATLTLTRNGAANSQDVFSATGTLSTLTQGGGLVVGGITVGTVTTNSNGTLLLTFNTNATQARVNSVLQQIAYSNSSDAPPASVQINWLFSDGNTGTQGTGGALTVTGSNVVNITAVNDAPTTSIVTLSAISEDSGARVITQAELLTNATDVEGNALTAASLSITSGSGSLVNNGNGTWTYTPASNDDTAVSFSYTITDGNGGSVAGIANLDITPINDAPVNTISGDGAVFPEESVVQLVGSISITDVDAGSGSYTVTLTVSPAAGTLTAISGSGVAVSGSGTNSLVLTGTLASINIYFSSASTSPIFTATGDFNGAVSFTLVTNDNGNSGSGGALTDSDTINGGISSVADISNDSVTTNEDASITFSPLSNDTFENSGRTISHINGASISSGQTVAVTGGNLTLNANGTLTYAPSNNYFGTPSFTYTVTSGGVTETATVNLTVNPVNDAPVTTPVTLIAIAEESGARIITQAELLANATDVEGNALTVTSMSIASGSGSLINNGNGTWTYTPASNDDTAVSFSYTITDGNGGSVAGSANLDITPVNDAPVITSNGGGVTGIASVSENQTTVTTVTVTDVDLPAQSINYSIVGGADAALFTINASTGALQFISGRDYEMPTDAGANNIYDVIVQVSDSVGGTDTQAIAISVTSVNEAEPVITNNGGGSTSAISLAENTTAVTTVTATDSDLPVPTLTYSISGGTDAAKFTINSNTGVLTFISAPNYEAPTDVGLNNVYDVNVMASDGSLTDTQAISVAVTNLDEAAPTITSGGVATAINENSGAGQVIYTATSTDSGDTATGSTSYSLGGTDAALFSINAATGAVTLLANPNFEAKPSYSFSVTATDAAGNASSQAVSLAIANLDEVAPTVTSGSVATAINENSGAGQVIYTATSTDSGDTATGSTSYSLGGTDAALFSINAATGAVTLLANPNFEAKPSYSFSVTATDAAGNASSQAVSLAIANLDEVAPTVTSGSVATAINENSGAGQVIYTATSTDSGDTATGSTSYSLGGTDAALFSINAATGAVTLLANPNFEAKPSYSFSVTATDAAGNASSQAVSLAIANLDEVAPTVTSGSVATAINENSGAGQVIYTATSTDSGDTATGSTSYSLGGTDAALFSINAATGAVTLLANPNFEAKPSYSFSVTATDAAGNASSQAVSLAIANLDEVAPTVTSGSVATAINENSGAGQVIYTATSTDSGDTATGSTSYSLGGTDAALFSINAATGAVTLLANPNFEAKPSYSFSVTATDAAGNASSQAVSLAIANLDEVAPTVTSGSVATAINENSGAGQVIYTATSTDSGDTATGSTSYSLGGTDAALFSINAATGAVTLLANPNFEAKPSYSFSVTATDAAGNASSQAVSLAIANLDEVAPTVTSGSVATAINENSGAGQVIYTATSTDSGDTATGSTSYSLGGTDAALFSINAATGAVTLLANPNFEAKPSYSFSVTATDAAGNASSQAVSLAIANLDEVAPTVTSGSVATAINENSGAGQVIYTATSTDSGDTATGSTSYSLGGTDAALFSINAATGAVTLLANPNFEAKPSYSFSVTATDAAGNASSQAVSLAIANLDEVAPTVTSGSVATAINENSGAGQVIYTATSTDSGDTATGSTSYSLGGTDAALFSINAATGAVTLLANPNFEAKPSYSFSVTATDAAGNASSQAVSLAIANLDEVAPTVTSGSVATAINENSGAGQVIYTATSTDSGDTATGSTSYSLGGTDAALFSINAATGAVTLLANPNFEAKPSYSFSVTATDAAGNASSQAVSLAIANLDEVAPTVTSGSVATAINENSGAGQVIYTATSTDSGDTATGSTSYSLGGTDAALFSINAATGAVTLLANPNFEAKPSYSFSVTATDAAGNASSQAVSLAIANLDEVAPTVTSGSVATAINENSGAGQVIYTATSTDSGDTATGSTSYSLGGTDAALFSINAATGAVTLLANPNFEAKPSYSFSVTATDAAGNASSQAVSLAIANLDEVAPTVTSGSVATAINENSGAGQVIYTATSTDSGDTATGSTSYSLGGTDAALFSINAATGAVTLLANPNFEAKPSYSFSVTATDAAGNASSQAVSLAIANLDEVAPTVTSGSVATAINENSGAGQVIYTATSTDSGDTATGSTSYSLGGTDAALFSINAATGAVTLLANPNFEAKPSYSFSVTATDAAGNASSQAVSLAIANLDEVAPTVTSGSVATAINENSGAGQVIYTATSTDSGDTATGSTSYSLGGTDAALFSINAATGAVTLLANPNFEAKPSYSFSVTATDAAGNASSQAVSLAIANLDEVAPTVTSGSVATAINENSGAGQVIYTATSTDSGDTATGSTSYSLGGTDAALFSINAATGAVTLLANPNFEAKPSYSFSVTATDAAGNASSQAVSLAIANLDEVAPTVTSGSVATAINENSGAGQVIYTATSTDSGDTATGSTSYSLGGTDAALFSINAATGAVTLLANPNFEAKPSYSFSVTATDAAGNASSQAVSLAIANLDEVAPTVTSGSVATAINENSGAGQVIYTATSTDSGDTATGSTSYSLGGTDAALFSINAATGAVTLLANPNFEAKPSYSFSVTATDAAGNASSQAVSLAIANLDEVAPTVTSGSVATAINENSGAGQVIYTATSTDSGDTATGSTSYSLGGTDAALFSINAATGAVTLLANPNFEAKPSYSFSVTATDAAGNASSQAVSLAIANLDEVAPTVTSGSVATAINENSGAGQVIYTATSTDSGDTATGSTSYSLGGTDAALFSINAATGAVTLLANPNFEAKPSYSFSVTATDAAGNASSQAVSLAIANLDEVAPTVTSGSVATAINENSGAGQVIYTATSTDSGDTATGSTSYSLGGTDAALFSINAATGAVTLLANPNFEAKPSYSFSVTATDAAGNASSQAVSLAIANLDEVAPTVTSGSVATAINENSGAGQVIYTATSTDSGDTATGSTSYSLGGTDAALFSINAATGAVTLLANPNFEAKPSYSFSVTATDAAGNASSQAVSLAIANLDEVAPTVTSGSVATAINENSGAGQVIYTATSTDSGDTATGSTSYSLGGTDAALFSINAATGAVTLLANPNFEAKPSYSFSVTATDAAGNASSQAVSLAIANLDEVAPTVTSGSVATAINENSGAGQVIYTATSTDSGDTATGSTSYSLGGTDAALFSINAATGAVTLLANPNFEAKPSYSFSVTATDAAGNASSQAVSLAIANLDEVAPTVTSGSVATAINENSGAGQVIYTATSTDSGDTATGSTSYSLGGTDAALFSINAATGAVTLLANPNFEAKPSYSFSVTATDAAGNASSQAVSLAIANLDEVAPTVTSGSVATAINENSGAGQVIYTATSTDSGDTATGSTSYSLGGTDAALFSINAATGAVTLLANPNFEAKPSYSFSVTATDAAGNASSQAVSLAIANLDEVAPTVTSGSVATAINENSGAGQVIYTATSTDSGDTATGSTSYSLGGTDAALFSINAATGAVTLLANPNFEAKPSYSFSVTATDAAGNASSQAVSLAIANLDEVAPTVTSGSVATAINENSGAGQVIYTATSTDSGDTATGSTSYSLGGTDAALFSINAATGAVTLLANPNFEAKPSYSFSVTATDAAGNASSQAVSLAIANLDEVAPTVTSGSVATAINENSGAGQVIYTATSTDSGDTATGSTSYSLGGTDAALFSINAATGAVTLLANPNFEAKPSYSFSVTATDAAGNASSQAVSLAIANLDEVAPTVTSGSVATAINENSGAGQVIYTATSTDSGDTATGSTSYSLGGTDAALFSIDATTGAVTLLANPNFEAKPSYSFSVTATDAAGNASSQAVSLAIANLDDVASTTSPVTLTAIDEDSGTRIITQAQLLANAVDIDSPHLKVNNLVIARGYGNLVDNGNGTWRYTPGLNDDTSVSFSYTITDGNGGIVFGKASMDILPINDAPTLIGSTNIKLASTNEGSVSSATTLTSILSKVSWSDVDSEAVTGIAVTYVKGNGTWQFSSDGVAWTDIGNVSTENALLLNATSQVRYIPASNNGEAASFGFKAWDQTFYNSSTNANPVYANIIEPIDPSAFSSSTASAIMDITPVNVTSNIPNITSNPLSLGSINSSAAYSLVVIDTDILSPQTLKIGDEIFLNKEDNIVSEPEVITNLGSYIEALIKKFEDSSVSGFNSKQLTSTETEAIDNNRHSGNIFKYTGKIENIVEANKETKDIEQEFENTLNRIRHQFDQSDLVENTKQIDVQIMLGTTVALTAGYVSWILRGGALLTSLLSTIPLFRRFDPIPILTASKRRKTVKENNVSEGDVDVTDSKNNKQMEKEDVIETRNE